MTKEQIKALKEVIELLEHISDKGGIMISGLMVQEYDNLKSTVEEIVEDNK